MDIELKNLSNPENIYVKQNSISDEEPSAKGFMKDLMDGLIDKNKYTTTVENELTGIYEDYIDNVDKYEEQKKSLVISVDEKDDVEDSENHNTVSVEVDDSKEPLGQVVVEKRLDIGSIDLDSEIESYENDEQDNSIFFCQNTNSLDGSQIFFSCFEQDRNINSVIACKGDEELSSSYVFDKDSPNELYQSTKLDLFNKYDYEPYHIEKNKHKKQKRIDRMGTVALSAMVMVGSVWASKYIN